MEWSGHDCRRAGVRLKLEKLWIDGYGRFSHREVELHPGLQIVAGPNEQGKSTLRHFVCDMLYGQKRNPLQRVYEASNETRRPWASRNGYGGRMQYRLDSGQLVEVQRSFDPEQESVRVKDVAANKDISSEFARMRNLESTFAEHHLGMSKEVFLGAATISHVTLDELGDREALQKIRERLLALADTGNDKSTSEHAISRLEDRILSVGRPSARTKPLPLARARLIDLQKEYEQALQLRHEIAALEEQRQDTKREIKSVLQCRGELEKELKAHEHVERAERLRRAEELSHRINLITKQSFEMAGVRDFPLEQVSFVEEAATLTNTAERKAKSTQSELESLDKQLQRAHARLEQNGAMAFDELDPGYETKLAEFEGQINRLTDRLNELKEVRDHAAARLQEAGSELETLPDFSRLSADPVDWLTQLASAFESARRTRDDEAAKLERLKALAHRKREERQRANDIFSSIDDFSTISREYTQKTREIEEALTRLQSASEAMQTRAQDLRSKMPGFSFIGAVSLIGIVFFVVAAYVLGNQGIFIPAIFCGALFLYSAAGVLFSRRGEARAKRELDSIKQKMAEARLADMTARETIEGLMKEADCRTIWELEALHDRYREDSVELSIIETQKGEQEEITQAAVEDLRARFAALRETFLLVGEELKKESDLQGAAMRSIGRYQEYRDAKRRASESRDIVERRSKEIEALEEALYSLKRNELELALEVRQLLRERHYLDEQKSDSALKALQGYRLRTAQLQQKRRDVDVLKGRVEQKKEQLEAEKNAFTKHLADLNRLLEKANVASIEDYRSKVGQARKYKEQWRERSALEEQLDALLGGTDQTYLRRMVENEADTPAPPARSAEEVKAELAMVHEQLEELRKADHHLHITITERTAGARTLNEIDEERAWTERRMQQLELEVQSASYAISVIEEVALERHSHLAPRLAHQASQYLAEITGGAYKEIVLDKNMNISVRIPQTKTLADDPERRLSKGTVDQIYLALRMAMVQALSEQGERVPMLLDDPFANYDDLRLARAMNLLNNVAQKNQVLLFTCRDDVVRAAKAIKAPVMRAALALRARCFASA